MKHFSELFLQLDQTTKTSSKVEALIEYFEKVGDKDRLWAIAILSHRRPRRTVKTSQLRAWAAECANIPLWLFEEAYHVVGDLAETIAHILPSPDESTDHNLTERVDLIKDLYKKEDAYKKDQVVKAWSGMKFEERFVFNKLITGGLRVGVSQRLMMRALARFENQDENKIAHRLMGNWTPDTTTYDALIRSDNPLDDISKPYPFYLAYALEDNLEELGAPSLWQVERKWDGIRGQIIVRDQNIFVWSRGEELITDKFPEYHPLNELLPDGTVMDGEILPYREGHPLSFHLLQTRIGRKNITRKVMETAPVIFKAYDLLEYEGEDIRQLTFMKRRQLLEKLLERYPTAGIVQLSEILQISKWEEARRLREESRNYHSEGLMLKRMDSSYRSGRKKGDWWKWKVDPLTIDAVMIYAQQGHGRRANLFTDYTFAVWDGDQLVPFTKAYSGLKDDEFREITSWVRKNTIERYGPVRSVKPHYVFEIAFEGINVSKRHKSGVALRFPRMLRWRKDKKTEEANSLDDLKKMLVLYG